MLLYIYVRWPNWVIEEKQGVNLAESVMRPSENLFLESNMENKPLRRIGFYIRVSTEKQAKETEGSLTSQKQRLESEVQRRNLGFPGGRWGEVVRVYIEEGRSGKDTNRPEYQKMLADIQTGTVNVVMVTELSRLSRSVSDFLRFMELLQSYNSDFICPQYDFDTTSAAGRVFVIILMALAQFERELTAERTKNNFYARALRGLCNGGKPILGYDRDPQNKAKRIVNEPEAAIVRKIFESYLENGSIRSTTDAVNQLGVRTKAYTTRDGKAVGGQLFVPNSIHGILSNPVYLAKREVNKQNKGKDSAALKDSEKYQVVPATWEPIVQEETFNLVQEKLEENRESFRHDQWKTYPFLFSKRLNCLDCGAEIHSLSGTGRSRKYSYYRHRGKCPTGFESIHADKLETLVLKRLEKLDAVPGLIEALTTKQHQTVSDSAPKLMAERNALEVELRETQKKAEAIVDRIASLPKNVDADFLITAVSDLKQRRVQISDSIARLDIELESIDRKKADPKEVRDAIQFVNSRLGDLSVPLRKDMIRRLISSVEFGKKEVSVVLNPKGLLEKDPVNPDGSGGGGGGSGPLWPGLSKVRVLSRICGLK